jgi:hypothetical protein
MAAAAGFRWESQPTELGRAADEYGARVMAALGELADLYAARLEAYAKRNAPWLDQSGNARQSLTGRAVKEATRVAIELWGGGRVNGQDTSYIVYLELGTNRMAPRPIIVPTIEAHAAEIMDYARKIVGDR